MKSTHFPFIVSAMMILGLSFELLLNAFSISTKSCPFIVCTFHPKASKAISNLSKRMTSFVCPIACCLFLSTITVRLLSLCCWAKSNHSRIDHSFNSPSLIATKTLFFFNDNAIPIPIDNPCHKDPAVASTHSIEPRVTCHHNFCQF